MVGLGIPTLLVLVGFFFLIQKGVGEVREMGPWPGPEVPPVQVGTVDLSNLGLELGQIQNAGDQETWAGGSYQDGVLITYATGGRDVVAIWALRYADKHSSGNDYSAARAWAEGGNCGAYATAYWGNSGVVNCQFTDAYDKLLWNDYWIVNIVALQATDFTPGALVDQVRDAMGAHWKPIAQQSQ